MRIFIRILILGILFIPFSLAARSLTLRNLVEEALLNSPSRKISIKNLDINKLKYKNSSSVFWPSLDIQVTQGFWPDKPTTGESDWTSELKLVLTSKIYNNGINIINYDKSQLALTQSEIENQKNISKVCLEISKEYYNYSLLNELLNIQKKQLSLVEKQFISIESQYKQGRKTRIDFIRFKSRLQRAKLSIKLAQMNKEKSIEDLKRLVAWSQPSMTIKSESIDSFDLDTIPNKAPELKNHFESKIASISKTINNLNINIEEQKYGPEISLNAGGSYTNTDYLSGNNSFLTEYDTNVSALLSVKLNLWDWGTRKRNVSIQKGEALKENFLLDKELLSVKANINKLMLDIKQQKENYLLNKELVVLEKDNYRIIENNYRKGKSTFLDLVNSLDNLTASKEAYLINYFHLKSLASEYHYHKGNIYEQI